jgi:hypothetical protein
MVVPFWGRGARLLPEADLLLCCTLQEGLANALEHSGASLVQAQPAFESSRVRPTVTDNGRGMSLDYGAPGNGGFGLSGLEVGWQDPVLLSTRLTTRKGIRVPGRCSVYIRVSRKLRVGLHSSSEIASRHASIVAEHRTNHLLNAP